MTGGGRREADNESGWSDHDVISIEIIPEPTEGEREAVVAALTIWLEHAQTRMAPRDLVSRWHMAMRRDAVQGIARGRAMGWGQRRSGWSRVGKG